MIKKDIPINEEHEDFDRINEIWNSVYKQRRQKVGRKRAIISANATVYSELMKNFVIEEEKRPRKSSERFFVNEEEKKYNDYEVGNVRVITTTEPKVLEQFPNAERKGKFKDMDDAFEREIVSKLLDKYEAPIHPEMYYVITGDR